MHWRIATVLLAAGASLAARLVGLSRPAVAACLAAAATAALGALAALAAVLGFEVALPAWLALAGVTGGLRALAPAVAGRRLPGRRGG